MVIFNLLSVENSFSRDGVTPFIFKRYSGKSRTAAPELISPVLYCGSEGAVSASFPAIRTMAFVSFPSASRVTLRQIRSFR